MDSDRKQGARAAAAARGAARVIFSATFAAMFGSMLACETRAVVWSDAAPVSTAQPSPLLGTTPLADSALADSSAMAAFLLTQDRLREAGGHELVASHLGASPGADDSVRAAMGAMAGMAHAVVPSGASELGQGTSPLDAMRCARSLRFADAPDGRRVAVWWSRRSEGRVALLAAWQDDPAGGGWRGPFVVDSLDQGPSDARAAERGAVGCMRTAPSVVIDRENRYVHVAYALAAPEGAGIFYAHQMDSRAQFETPKVIVYGDHLGAARVAAVGDVVAVAYDDPNGGARNRVSLAISRTSGHDFLDRLVASADNANARDPFVAVRGRAIVVGWSDVPVAGGDTTFRIRRARVQ